MPSQLRCPSEDRIYVGKFAQAATENITAEPAAMPSKKPAAKAVAKPAGNKPSLAAGVKTAADLHAQCDSLIARSRMLREAAGNVSQERTSQVSVSATEPAAAGSSARSRPSSARTPLQGNWRPASRSSGCATLETSCSANQTLTTSGSRS